MRTDKQGACYGCKFRRGLANDHHSQCIRWDAKAVGNAHAIRQGWFDWPVNFDPLWLVECDGFEEWE